jgi:hypothetical protein
MINFNDLKENTLLVAEKDFNFYVYNTIAYNYVLIASSSLFSYSSNKYYEFSSKFLILLKDDSMGSWVCFCNGKICKFTIDKFDCERITQL